jgi:hypothetical protein
MEVPCHQSGLHGFGHVTLRLPTSGGMSTLSKALQLMWTSLGFIPSQQIHFASS